MQSIKQTVKEIVIAVTPITLVVIILQMTLMKVPLETLLQFLVGVLLVSSGLIIFLLGVQIGLLPMGEQMGEALAKTGKLSIIVLFGFALGLVAAIAEPNLRILAVQMDFVSEGTIPKNLLIYSIALGVAFSVALAMLRLVLKLSLTRILIIGYALIFALALVAPPKYFPISFDAGGMTTGPLLIPFVLALGVGVASVLRGGDTTSEGFGLVGLAYIGPVLAVLLLGVVCG
ncbi:MAG TPA: DUF1538 domain-containing protein [Gelria sp.]|nr:DUF1538 domain-containing protein [Gelria sp.]